MGLLKKVGIIKSILIFLSLAFILVIYKSNYIMFSGISFVEQRTEGRLDLSTSRNFIMNVVDDLNPLKGKIWNQRFNVPQVNLSLSRDDLDHFEEVIKNARQSSKYAFYMPNEINVPINTDIKIDGIEYKAELKLHGTNNPHFVNPKKSYAVKIRNKDGKEYPNGMRRFGLVIPTQSNLVAIFTYKIANLLNMPTPENFLVRVYLNGVDQGIYHLEEKLNKTLLERQGLSGHDVVRSDDSWAHQYANNHGTMFSFDYSGLQPRYTSGQSIDQITLFKNILNTDNINFIKNNIDEEEFIKYDVLRYIFGDSGHMTSHDNIKFIYSTSSGRLKPYFRIENHIEKIISNNLTFSPEQHVNFGAFTSNKLLMNLTMDNEYRAKRNREMYKLIKQREEVLKIFDLVAEDNLPVLLNDTTNELPSRYFEYEYENARKNLIHNFDFIEKYLNYSRAFVEIIKKDDNRIQILIKPDSNAEIALRKFTLKTDQSSIGNKVSIINMQTSDSFIKEVKLDENGAGEIDLLNVFEDLRFSLSLDEYLEPKKNTYSFELFFNGDITDAQITFFNTLSEANLLERDSYLVFVDESNPRIPSIPDFIERTSENNLIIKSGNHYIYEDVVIPFGKKLTIEKGTNLFLDEGVSFLTRGSLEINGEKDQIVVVSSISPNKPFGAFASVGNGQTTCNINFLNIYGGSEDVINNIYLSGALSLYHHSFVSIKNSFFHHNYADDGLNVKNASFLLDSNTFFSNAADQVDIDTGDGKVVNNIFSKIDKSDSYDDFLIPPDDNGDGLDLSDSKALIMNNSFISFADKGISIGENTKAFLKGNIFESNRSAITAKDQSNVFLSKNIYSENIIQLEMFQKKLFFQHPSVYNLNDELESAKIKKTIESKYFKTDTDTLNLLNDINLEIIDQLYDLNWQEYE